MFKNNRILKGALEVITRLTLLYMIYGFFYDLLIKRTGMATQDNSDAGLLYLLAYIVLNGIIFIICFAITWNIRTYITDNDKKQK
jgi:hypothetical protein